ncbi:MAG: acyltransferase [Legionellaceae bacterium]|nr:acyltransferase [Legionellaceae bacterium]
MKSSRCHGLDTLRAAAIILVFMFHCFGASHSPILKAMGARVGWVGVDLFFVLSGYLIANQIFSAIINRGSFSLKTFYFRRFIRTLPNYFLILGLYFTVPIFSEQPLTTPLWKFITFTQNFGLSFSAFSHAWSLCIEEQFYFFLPIVVLFIAYKGSIRTGWLVVILILFAGIILRSSLWLSYIQHVEENKIHIYMTKIYYCSFCRLDGLVLGVSIAMLQNFHQKIWVIVTKAGNWFMVLGLIGCYFTFYFIPDLIGFTPTAFGYLLRSASFAALTVAALSSNTLLHRTKIPGAMTLSIWSYAIYLTHKQIIHMTQLALPYFAITEASTIALVVEILFSLISGWLLYTCIEAPFLKLRDKPRKAKSTELIFINKNQFGSEII